MPIPEKFCWSRFGTEAGETIDEILQRKELERQRNRGVFLWGIGNALGPSIRELIRHSSKPQVLFSPILSKPKIADVAPEAVARWRRGRDLHGEVIDLSKASIVTSRMPTSGTKRGHYALVCYSSSPLAIAADCGKLPLARLQNLLTGRKVGASQVTAVVKMAQKDVCTSSAKYPIAIRATLVYPYFLSLIEPSRYSGCKAEGSSIPEVHPPGSGFAA